MTIILSAITGILIVLLTFLFAVNHVMAVIYAHWAIPNYGAGSSISLSIFVPQAVKIATLSGQFFMAYFSFIMACIILSVVYGIIEDGRRLPNILSDALNGRLDFRSDNIFVLIPQILMIYFFVNAVYTLLLILLGAHPVNPIDMGGFESWRLLFVLANASVYEELAFRVLYIGIPLVIVHMVLHRPKKPWHYLLGGGFEIRLPETFFLFLSSAIFGYAHVLHGWDIYKFPTAALMGIFLGYLFLKKGLYAAILLHFSVNYFMAFWLIPGLPDTVIFLYIGIYLLLMLSSIILGPAYIVKSIGHMLKSLGTKGLEAS